MKLFFGICERCAQPFVYGGDEPLTECNGCTQASAEILGFALSKAY